MQITAKMVKELREMTGAGMMDCKKALTASDGDMDGAREFLRKKGLAAMEKKASRVAAEGLVTVVTTEDHKAGAIVEVNTESDFVAKNEKFQNYCARIAAQILKSDSKDVESFMEEKWIDDESLTVQQELSEMISIIGEKLTIRRFKKIENPGSLVFAYTHGGGRIGVLTEVATNGDVETVSECGKEVCLQVASMKPKYVNRSEVDQAFLDHEREILMSQIMNDPKESQKPEKVINGIITGRINKELKEICLDDQVYIRAEDGKQSVSKYVASVAKEKGIDLAVKSFVRYEAGEGLEKRQDNFAEEVAKQMNM